MSKSNSSKIHLIRFRRFEYSTVEYSKRRKRIKCILLEFDLLM